MRRRPWILALAFVLGACPSPPAKRAVGHDEVMIDVSPATGGFELLHAGEEPRAALRLVPDLGQRELLNSSLAMKVGLIGDGLPPLDQRLPPVEQRTALEVIEVGAETLGVRFTFEGVALVSNQSSPELAARLRASGEAVAGASEIKRISTRGGFVDGGVLAVPEGADDKLRRTLSRVGESIAFVLVRFPDEPVGVGARWKYTERLRSEGLELERTIHVRLVEREGDRVTFELAMAQRCLSERVKREGFPGEVEVREFDSRGSARVVYELDKLVPVEASATSKAKLGFTLLPTEDSNTTREVTTHVELKLELPP